MIRKTVARAFASAEEDVTGESAGLPRSDIGHARRLKEVFEHLHRVLMEKSTHTRGVESEAVASPSIQVSDIGPCSSGIEFGISTEAGRFRVVNSLKGVLWMHAEPAATLRSSLVLRSSSRSVERMTFLLSFCPDETGTPQLIQKPLTGSRTSFCFTSVPSLVSQIVEGC